MCAVVSMWSGWGGLRGALLVESHLHEGKHSWGSGLHNPGDVAPDFGV